MHNQYIFIIFIIKYSISYTYTSHLEAKYLNRIFLVELPFLTLFPVKKFESWFRVQLVFPKIFSPSAPLNNSKLKFIQHLWSPRALSTAFRYWYMRAQGSGNNSKDIETPSMDRNWSLTQGRIISTTWIWIFLNIVIFSAHEYNWMYDREREQYQEIYKTQEDTIILTGYGLAIFIWFLCCLNVSFVFKVL